MEATELDWLAASTLRSAGLDLDAPPNPVVLARAVVGPIYRAPLVSMPGDAALVRVRDEWRIYVRGGMSRSRARWAILHEVAEWILLREGPPAGRAELLAQALAARLAAPHTYALRVCLRIGPRYEQLALDFGFDQTASALRFGEVTETPIAVVAPHRCYVRGVPDSWAATEEHVRRLAKTQPPGFVLETLTDAPSRVVIRGA